MVPEITPAYAGNSVFVSLYINNISLDKFLIESTSYFLKKYIYINNLINYSEIQPKDITVGLTPYNENETPSTGHPKHVLGRALKVSDSHTLDSKWGI